MNDPLDMSRFLHRLDREPPSPPDGYVDASEWCCIRDDMITSNLEALHDSYEAQHFDELCIVMQFDVPDVEPDATCRYGLERYYQPPVSVDFRRELLRQLRKAAAALAADLEERPKL